MDLTGCAQKRPHFQAIRASAARNSPFSAPQQQPPAWLNTSAISMTQASIVLVEDEALIRMMLVEMVDKMGHIVVAEAGSVAVEPARSCEPAQQSD